MSVLRDLLDDYLTTRRALGFMLAVPGRVLGELTRLLTHDEVSDDITALGGSLLYRYFA